MTSVRLATFTQRRSLILLCLGFASGLPLALTSGTLQAWMTEAGLDLKTIGFFSLVGQAYVFKFLWSPVIDRYSPPLMGRRRGWLVICQALLIVGLQAMMAPLRDFFSRDNAWLILMLIVLYKLGDAFALSLSTTFLIRGVGFDAGQVGMINKSLGLLATIIGTLAGGLLMQRLSLFRALMLFGLLQALNGTAGPGFTCSPSPFHFPV